MSEAPTPPTPEKLQSGLARSRISCRPWERFLAARADVIEWLMEECGYSEMEVAEMLSMDARQILLVRSRVRDTTSGWAGLR